MTRYGRDYYGQDPNGSFVYYGLTFDLPNQIIPTTAQYTVDPFTAVSIDYNHILLNWTQPATAGWTGFRLLSNRFGFPVDENDGTLLVSSDSSWPGSQFLDPNVIPGTYHHYAVYLQVPPPPAAPALNRSFDSWTSGHDAAFISTSNGTSTLTNNIPHGSPYPYGIKFVSQFGFGNTSNFSFPYNAPVIIQPSTQYTVTAWVYSPTGTVYLGMNWEVGSNTFVSSNVNSFTVPVNTWTQISSTVTSPSSGATYGSALVYGSSSSSQPIYTMYATGITLQVGATNTISASQAQGKWVRAGLAACLAPTNYNSVAFLFNNIPEYFKTNKTGDLTTDTSGNPFLQQYLSIIGWSIDYLKTALFVAQNVNNPAKIPLNDLYNLAITTGFPFEPEISPGVIRNGLANVAQLVQQRGTLEGIVAYTTNLAGMSLDLQVGYNMMLDDNTSNFIYPKALGIWNATYVYQTGDIVDFGQYKYVSNITGNVNNAPSGTTSNNASWNALYYTSTANSPGYITNPLTNWPSSYEPRWANKTNKYPNDVTALRESVGILNPLNTSSYQSKGLKIKNNSGSQTTIDIRSVSRTPADIAAGYAEPDQQQVINDGIPVPYLLPQQQWNSTTTYATGQIVSYQGLPFIALKANLNIVPTSDYSSSNEWQPLGYDSRIQLMTSAFASGDSAPVQFNIQPYVSLYDQSGIHIGDVLPRNPSLQVFDASCAATTNQSFTHTSSTVLTASSTGVTTIDGVVINSTSQNVLLTGQTSQPDNGYYDVTTVGAIGIATVLTRYAGLSAAQYPNSYAFVEGGTSNTGQTFYCTNTSTPTLGSTNLTFSTTMPAGSFYPTQLIFDSFAKPSDWGANATAHSPEVGQTNGSPVTYTAQANNFIVDAFNNGVVRPSNPNTQCLVTTDYGNANAMIGITFVTIPSTLGFIMGLAGRVASSSSYIRISQNAIVSNNAGVLTVLANHSTPAKAGDRLTALFNGNVITVYVNGIQVSTATTSFNNSQTKFGYIYESASTINGTTQTRATVAIPRRSTARGRRAFTAVTRGAFIWHLNGTVQPRATVPVPRRLVSRSYNRHSSNTYTYYTGGQTQPRTAQPNQRSLVQRNRALVQFRAVTTTNVPVGSVQPDSTVMLPRRRSARAAVYSSPNTFSFFVNGTVQPLATLPHQRVATQRTRGVYGGHAINTRGPSGRTQRQIAVFQRGITQRARARVRATLVAAELFGPGKYGPGGRTQQLIPVYQRSLSQRSRAHVGNQSMSADVEEIQTYFTSGHTQPRATIAVPRRTSTRAKIGKISTPYGEETGNPAFGPSGLQPLTAKPVQRLLSQRSRAVIKGVANYEIGPEQPRGPSGKTQPRQTLTPARRYRVRAVVGNNSMCGDGFGKTTNVPAGRVGGLVTRRTRTPHRRTQRNG